MKKRIVLNGPHILPSANDRKLEFVTCLKILLFVCSEKGCPIMRTHYNLPLPFARPASKEPLDCYRRSANRVSQTSVEKPCLASTGRLYTARGPFKDLISRRRWIKIRTSSFLKSKCIIVRFRAMDARPPRGESLVATAFESEPLTRCRSTATSRRGNFRPDGPY